MIRKIVLAVLFLTVFIVPHNVFATTEFSTSYDVLYDVGEDGITTVTEKITLQNLTSKYYANQFKLTIGGTTQISDIKGSDPGGALNINSEQKNTSTTLSVKFNQQIAGIGKTLPWTLSFKSKDFAQKLGKVWEVRAPKISATSNLGSYNLTLAVPQSFGDLSLISPTPINQTKSGNKIFLTFNADQLKSSGISASFGLHQLFDFDLSYHLENQNLMPILTNIALPPDSAFQDVIYQRIEPKPLNVTVDSDGNFLAWYKISRNQKIDVRVFGSAKLYTSSKVKSPYLDEVLRKKYTSADKYWEKDNPQIKLKLNEILGDNPPADSEGKAKLIFQFVVDTLKYDSTRLKGNSIERLGALTVLNNPASAVCMEFTDLFIALSRAAGIPARELDGFAYTNNTTLRPLSLNKDILHSWPEYWSDRRGWVMVDPTWENTTGGVDYFSKLDLNHFVFAIKGSSSENPIPAGSYKYNGQDSKDVKVTLSDTDFLGHPQLDVVIEAPNPIFAGFPGSIKVKVTNTGNAFYPPVPFAVSANTLSILNASGQNLGIIPAFGSSEFSFNIRTKSLFDLFNDQITVRVAGQKFTKDIAIKPFVLFQTIPLIIGGVIALMVLVYLAVLGGLVYRKRVLKRKK